MPKAQVMTGIEGLFNAAWTAPLQRPDSLTATKLQPFPPAMPGEARAKSQTKRDLPALQHLSQAIALARQFERGELADLIEANLESLVVHPGFMSGYAFAMLSGLDSPIVREAPTCGFILLAPELHYPGHQHAPREIYLPLTPDARWRLEDGDWFDVALGDLILHDAWVIHATKTGAQPFLAFVAWLDPTERAAINWANA